MARLIGLFEKFNKLKNGQEMERGGHDYENFNRNLI